MTHALDRGMTSSTNNKGSNMKQLEVITKLREEAKKNPVANAFFLNCAMRRRSRSTVTLHSLLQKMKNEGFNFTSKQYEEVIKLLASLEIGKLDTDYKGRVRGLKDIGITLQSLGKAACANSTKLEVYKPNPVVLQKSNKPKILVGVKKSTFLTFYIGDNAMKIEIPSKASAKDIAELIDKLK